MTSIRNNQRFDLEKGIEIRDHLILEKASDLLLSAPPGGPLHGA